MKSALLAYVQVSSIIASQTPRDTNLVQVHEIPFLRIDIYIRPLLHINTIAEFIASVVVSGEFPILPTIPARATLVYEQERIRSAARVERKNVMVFNLSTFYH